MDFRVEPAGQYRLARDLIASTQSPSSRAGVMAVDHFDPTIAQRAKVCGLGTTLPTGIKWDEKFWSVVTENGKPKKYPGTIKGIQWCGIYATWVWQQSGVDDVVFEIGKGVRFTGSKNITQSNDLNYLAPGDIIVDCTAPPPPPPPAPPQPQKQPVYHHMLVLNTNATNPVRAMFVHQGNSVRGPETESEVSNGDVASMIGKTYLFYSLDTIQDSAKFYRR
jgi:hypothetical protein